MGVNAELRVLDIDIPAQPDSLVRMSLLLARESIDLPAVAGLVESDMALAAAVLKAVNSSLYGVSGRVQSVQQAITYLGLREVSGITYEMGLRAAFPPAAELDPLWDRAARRGLVMGRLAQLLEEDAWAAHSAGLFEECGKAVLFRHARDHYRSMLRAAVDDVALLQMEKVGFGVAHDALGAALCESWGLAAAAVASVRQHVGVLATGELPADVVKRPICGLSVIANALLFQPEALEPAVERIAPQTAWDPARTLKVARRVQAALEPITA
jgi:HD-like signal output (HDOD) protein